MGAKAILLAAGKGSRLLGRLGYVKIAVKIGGIPLICYPVTSLAAAGISEVYVATRRERVDLIKALVSQYPLTPMVEVIAVEKWWAGNAWTMLEALESVGRGVWLISMSDHIYPPGLASKVAKGCLRPVCIGGDSSPRHVDVGEATKIKALEGGVVAELGKGIPEWTHVDVGVHLLSWGPLTSRCVLPVVTLNEVNTCNASNGLVGVVDVTGHPWMDIDSPEDLNYALKGPARASWRRSLGDGGLEG